jgi:hypothetical protein
MYTLHMSWPFRSLVLSVALAWTVAPQLACLMPEQVLTKAEMDCCERMAGECSGVSMSHACCRPVTRTDIGIGARVVREVMPVSDLADSMVELSPDPSDGNSHILPNQNNHAPPPGPMVSSSILRI